MSIILPTINNLIGPYLVVSDSGVQGRYSALEDAKNALNGITGIKRNRFIAEVNNHGILIRDPQIINGHQQSISNGFNRDWCSWKCINPLMDVAQNYLDSTCTF
jgi:hypothetical protein